MRRARYQEQALGQLYNHITAARVLLVGAGGIGCELLKNLVLTGFSDVTVVDLDTIDLSNLNRQFLFRHEHIKKSKSLVAKETAQKFNPNVRIDAHHANIKDPQFSIDWFGGYTVVFNALDNLEARRHVNKMCLAADVPLIESGTTGFNGQVQVIKKGRTECYDCNVKETPKSFPVCTIRSTPSQLIHCIVWAKSYLFTEIFGTSEDETPEMDHSTDAENAEEIENLRREAHALKKIRESMDSQEFPRMVFTKVFEEDIERLRSMEDMWKSRKPPEALHYDNLSQHTPEIGSVISSQDRSIWTMTENFAVFTNSLKRLSERMAQVRAGRSKEETSPPVFTFDKDDQDILDFVVASANLRSLVFGIETKSKFDIKQMAGNIIPAIATTNAMTAGLCVLQAFKVLNNQIAKAKMAFLTRSADRIISAESLRPPNPDCAVCGPTQSRLVVDTSRATLNDLVDGVLRLELGYGDELSIANDVGVIYEPDFEDNLPKKFADLGIKGDSFITVIDENEVDPKVNLVLSISEKSLPDDSKPLMLPAKVDLTRKPKADSASHVNGHAPPTTNGTIGKRKRDADELEPEDDQIRKRGKVFEEKPPQTDDDVVILDDSDQGAIVIDDD